MPDDHATQTLLKATKQRDLAGALAWIAEGHTIKMGTTPRALLEALAQVDSTPELKRHAARRLTREVANSELDTAAVLFEPETIVAPRSFRAALDRLAWKSPDHDLTNINADAVAVAQREDRFVIETLCAVAGISYRDLVDRVHALPAEADASWGPSQIRAAFSVIDDLVRGKVTTDVPGAVPTRAIELFIGIGSPPPGLGGWNAVEQMRRDGVPFEVLLAQRHAGSAWGAHRNKTAGKIGSVIASALCAELHQRSVSYRLATTLGGEAKPGDVQKLARSKGQVGLVALNTTLKPRCAVVISIARDGGTARANAGKLRTMGTATEIPVLLVLVGPGWKRNETAELALHFGGRIYSEQNLDTLADDISAMVA